MARATERLQQLVNEFSSRTSDEASIPDITLAAAKRDSARGRSLVERVRAIGPAELTHEEQITRELLEWEGWKLEQAPALYWYPPPLLPAISPLRTAQTALARKRLTGPKDREEYLALLSRAATLFAAMQEKLKGQSDRGIILPREQVDNVLPYLRSFAAAADSNPFAIVAAQLASVSPADAAAFRRQAEDRLTRDVAPAARALAEYVERELRPRAPAAVGIWQYPGGKEAYRTTTRIETTLDVTPEQVHEIGLRAVDTINAEMARLRDSLGFRGSKAEFHETLRRDPRFYEATPDAVAQRLMKHAERLAPKVGQYFSRAPRAPYGVKRLDPTLEPSMTYGYYSLATADDPKGYYNFNASHLDRRPLLTAAALIFHELVPGHHFQINLARENESLTQFRRTRYYAGYNEGWGEYSSSVVAREMGMYEDPYDLYGRLVFDMFFAVRLVVDTGMNYHGWSRERAMAYMREHTLESEVQIDSETLRYSTRTPAQALAYRMGREIIVDLRRKGGARARQPVRHPALP